ncbi:MAG: tetratricopeptide repeat protein [Candidatus Krumholzibacteriales bacterium]
MFVLAAALAVSAAAAQERIPLDKKLEGLDPRPRISYLKYVLEDEGGGGDLFFHLGVAFHELGEADSAIHYYQRAVREDSAMFKAFVNMGILYDEDNIMMKAVENYKKALEIRPDDVLANTHLGSLFYRNEVFDLGVSYLMRALESDPSNPQPHYYLGSFFADSGIYREALREWRKVIKLEPGGYLASRARKNIEMIENAMKQPPVGETYGPDN